MQEKKNILFDLDGTITESELGITKSVQIGLQRVGIIETNLTSLKTFIGPPLHVSFQKYYGISGEDYKKALDGFHEYYRTKGIFECEIYLGIEILLKKLRAKGKHLFVATSKPETEAKRVLEYFGLTKYFDFIGGSDGDLGTTRSTKALVIQYVLEKNGLKKSDCIMIGDRSHDIIGAKEVGLSSVGVLYGYGDRVELYEAGADYICEDVQELEHLLMK